MVQSNSYTEYYEKKVCRLCKASNLATVLDLGNTHLADEFTLKDSMGDMSYQFPLKLNLCIECGWLQTSIVVNPIRLYQNEYPYDSSATRTGREHWAELAESLNSYTDWGINKTSLDIGANVGVLVRSFNNFGFQALGVDPSREACDVALKLGTEIIQDFFDLKFANVLSQKGMKFDVITATNVFAHIDDLENWTLGVLKILKDKGTLVIEVPHALKLVNYLQFDTIYHEHLSYVSLKPLLNFFHKFNLEINHVEERPIHGGTIRIYISRVGVNPVNESVVNQIKKEDTAGIHSLHTLENFSKQVVELIQEVKNFVLHIKAEGRKLVVVSAPAKGMTFLNVTDLKKPQVSGISDVAIQKYGRYAPGTGLKVVSDEDLALLEPDYALILAWNFADEIIDRIRFLYGEKTKFFVAIPTLREI